MSPPVDPQRPTIERAMEQQDQRRRDLSQLLGEQYAGHPAVTPLAALLIERLYTYRVAYLNQGRAREGHGVGRAIQVVWHTVLQQYKPPKPDFAPTLPAGLDL